MVETNLLGVSATPTHAFVEDLCDGRRGHRQHHRSGARPTRPRSVFAATKHGVTGSPTRCARSS